MSWFSHELIPIPQKRNGFRESIGSLNKRKAQVPHMRRKSMINILIARSRVLQASVLHRLLRQTKMACGHDLTKSAQGS